MSARVIVANELKAGLPTYRVLPYAVNPDGVEGITISVERTSTQRGVAQGLYADEISVYVLTSYEAPERAEDALDDALEAVLRVLQSSSALSFTRAERSSIENHHGYIVTATVQIQIQEN